MFSLLKYAVFPKYTFLDDVFLSYIKRSNMFKMGESEIDYNIKANSPVKESAFQKRITYRRSIFQIL